MVKRIVVGAHYGLKDWLAQRITALVMAAYTLVVGIALLQGAGGSFAAWHAFMSSGLMRISTFVLVVSLLWHAWVGVRDIWMDYVHSVGVRLALHVITLLLLVGYAGWAIRVLWRL